jgi:hypothetical protein
VSDSDAIKNFRAQLDDFVADEDVVWLDDEAWWERLGDLLDVVYAARARERRAEREANRCPALYRGTTRCVRNREHAGHHYSPVTGQWKSETQWVASSTVNPLAHVDSSELDDPDNG